MSRPSACNVRDVAILGRLDSFVAPAAIPCYDLGAMSDPPQARAGAGRALVSWLLIAAVAVTATAARGSLWCRVAAPAAGLRVS